MYGIIRIILILFCKGKRFSNNRGPHDGLIEIPSEDGYNFQFRKFVFTSIGKIILNNGDYICNWRGRKFVIDKEGFINKNLIREEN